MPENIKTVVGIYTRVSTQEQATEGYSIGEQKDRLEKYADAHGWVVYKIYSDPGFSGGNIDRPALWQLIRDVEHGRLNKILVYKLDRLSRSQKDTLYLIEDVFTKNHVDFVSMTENFDTGSPLGRAMIGILSVFAQLEREQIKERMQIGLDARAKEGYYHGGGYAPIGYRYQHGELSVDEYEAMQIREIYRLFFDGLPIYSIYKHMVSKGYQTQYGQWTDSSIRSCLTSIIYTGQIQWKGQIHRGRHEAIIDLDTFNRAQEELKKRSDKQAQFRKNPFQRTSMLGGLLWCGNCGARYFVKQNTSKRPGITPAQRYYTCYSRGKTTKSMIKDPNCKNKSWNVKVLDEVILKEIEKLALDPEYFADLLPTEESDSKDTSVLLARLADIDKQQNRLLDLYQIGNFELSDLNQRIEKLNSEKERIEVELDNAATPKSKINIEDATAVLQNFSDALKSADSEELKSIVHNLIDGIIINGEDVEIHWTFA